MKAFADEKLNSVETIVIVRNSVENLVEKKYLLPARYLLNSSNSSDTYPTMTGLEPMTFWSQCEVSTTSLQNVAP